MNEMKICFFHSFVTNGTFHSINLPNTLFLFFRSDTPFYSVFYYYILNTTLKYVQNPFRKKTDYSCQRTYLICLTHPQIKLKQTNVISPLSSLIIQARYKYLFHIFQKSFGNDYQNLENPKDSRFLSRVLLW